MDEVRTEGYEDPGLVDVGVALPVVSTLTTGERGCFEVKSAEIEGVLPG